MPLTLKQKIQQFTWWKAFTPDGHEIKTEKTIQQTDSGPRLKVRVYVPETGEEVAEYNYSQKRRFGLKKWTPTMEWCGPNNVRYLLFNYRTP